MTGQPDWQNDMRKAFAGLTEAFAQANARMEAHKLREGEDGYLAYDTAWECAGVEYVWRMRHAAAVTGRLRWKNFCKAALSDLKEEATARRTAEGERDTYKARFTASDVPTEMPDFEATGALIPRQEAKTVWDVVEGGKVIGVVRDNGHRTYNAYVGPTETFVGVYRYADQAARAVRASAGPTEPQDTGGVLVTPREGSAILNVDRPGKAGGIGYLRPVPDGVAGGWNAYVYRPLGTEKFVGWYDDADKAARAVDREYGR